MNDEWSQCCKQNLVRYAEIKHADWLDLLMWLATSHQRTSFQCSIVFIMSPDFHWQKVCQQSVTICFVTTLTPFVKPCKVLRGYLDVAIAKIRETCMQSCDKDSQTCSFANFSQWLHLNNLAKKLSVKLAKNGCKNIWSVKVGVHRFHRLKFVYHISVQR